MPPAIYNPNVAASPETHSGGRILALDVGKKRIGLAISDELRLTAQGIETLERTRIRQDLQRLQETIDHWAVSLILVGKPLHMSGSESRQSQYTEEFATRLGEYTGRPLVHWDERLTSVEAERMLKQAGASLDQRKKSIDRLAAVLLLESYLGYLRLATEATAGGALG